MKLFDFTWSDKHLNKFAVLRFFGANTPELVTQVLKLSSDLNEALNLKREKSGKKRNSEYTFVERLCKFIAMLKPTGCYTDVANFAYYVTEDPRERRSVDKMDIKIPNAKTAAALKTLQTDFLEPLHEINRQIDEYEARRRESCFAGCSDSCFSMIRAPKSFLGHSGRQGRHTISSACPRLTQETQNAITKIVDRFPHMLYHDSERDDICVFAIMAYVNKTLNRLLKLGGAREESVFGEVAGLELKVVEFLLRGSRGIVVQLPTKDSLENDKWNAGVLKRCNNNIDEAQQKLAAVKHIYTSCGVRILEDVDSTNFAQVIEASWDL